jgi:hypothetical protein
MEKEYYCECCDGFGKETLLSNEEVIWVEPFRTDIAGSGKGMICWDCYDASPEAWSNPNSLGR